MHITAVMPTTGSESLNTSTGDLTPQPHGGGTKAKLDEKRLLKMAELIAECQPDPAALR